MPFVVGLVEQGQDAADGCDGQDVEGADVDFAVHGFAFRVKWGWIGQEMKQRPALPLSREEKIRSP